MRRLEADDLHHAPWRITTWKRQNPRFAHTRRARNASPKRSASLAPTFTERAAKVDENDSFVAENFALLKDAGLIEAGVPRELGGGGAEVAELADMLRELAHACGSTALAFSMHTHQVAIPAWRWRHQKVAAVEPLLKRIAAERIILLVERRLRLDRRLRHRPTKVEGGYRVTARKVFTSGAPRRRHPDDRRDHRRRRRTRPSSTSGRR